MMLQALEHRAMSSKRRLLQLSRERFGPCGASNSKTTMIADIALKAGPDKKLIAKEERVYCVSGPRIF
jgi:hypothetical protein